MLNIFQTKRRAIVLIKVLKLMYFKILETKLYQSNILFMAGREESCFI